MESEEEILYKARSIAAFSSSRFDFNEDFPEDIKFPIGSDVEITKKVTVESKNRIKGKTRLKNKDAILLSKNKDFSCSISDFEISYDKYEEDESLTQWQLSKPRKVSPFSSLLREWSLIQLREIEIMTKKAHKALEKEQAATAAAEAEKIREQMIKDMHEEIRMEKYNLEKQALLEKQEAEMRKIQLEETQNVLRDYKNAFAKYIAATEEEENWLRYLTCDGLPDPGRLSEMNTYIFLWSMEDEKVNMSNFIVRYNIIIYLLTKLDEIIRFSVTKPPDYVAECETIRQQFRDKLREWTDAACYSLLREIERDMVREGIKTARYTKVSDQIIYCVWALIKLPIGLKQVTDKDRKPIDVHFEELELTVKMPFDIDCYCMAIRALWLNHDYYSDCAISYVAPRLPEEYENMYTIDFFAYCQNEYDAKFKIREDQVEGRQLRLEEKKAILEKIENPPVQAPMKPERKGKQKKLGALGVKRPEPEQETEKLPYLPTPDEIILQRDDEVRKEIRKLLFTRCEKTEINLRKYRILGGVLHIDLVYQPPQPKDMSKDIMLTTLQVPKKLKYVPFYKPYKAPPPAPDSERTPEVIEAEMKALETAMEALVLVTLKLPSSIIWFEPPLVAHWIPEKNIWSTQDVHDIKYNEEKQTITFRTGRLGVHGLAAFKFVNIPFQSWELKPEMGRNARGGVVLNISGAIIQAEFIVREDLICLNSLAGGTSTALKAIMGEYMRLYLLIEKMRDAGCDLFPERDAFGYVKALPVKHPVTEKHLRECIALLCTTYTFSWSRWNASRNSREIVIQFKELHGCVARERTNLTLLITPLRTMIVSCTEVSSEFSDVPLDGENSKFYADLYHLALQNAGIKSRLLMKNVSFKLANTVMELLGYTNVINMSS
ncbi:LOW QUALITY PROTEIN: dynein axonemal intermediate chain 7 [Anoplolepis gracilipes]|uniref:LOW QUALITY PROTEIN: dynein axonemal intermediate chain 7 n=1 Tax=Anoplolepis gracilipes TaxID=354296 RepID=UPI003BA172CF